MELIYNRLLSTEQVHNYLIQQNNRSRTVKESKYNHKNTRINS